MDSNTTTRPEDIFSTSLSYMIWGPAISQALYVTAKLGIADLLQDGPKTAPQLAEAVGANPVYLGRVLRALTTFDVFKEDEEQRFTTTARGERLRSDHPHSQRAMAMLNSAPFIWKAWGDMYHAVKTGTPAFDHAHGESFFSYLGRTPEDAALFNQAMTKGSSSENTFLLDAYDLSGNTTIVDVGGGHGAYLRGILERYPHMRGVLCDLPAVIAGADHLRNSAVADRCEFVPIDMFKEIPSGGDLYILKEILHDWNDEQCLQILKNCRQASKDGGKVLHIGSLLKPSNARDFGRWVDVTMMTMLTGRERSEADLRELYASAGFELTRAIVIVDGLAIVEGVAV